jgi:hypothetical protein
MIMRYLLIVFMFLNLSNLYAGDTLTRGDIYSYNIGDTFDYSFTQYYYGTSPIYSDSSTHYSRLVISNIYRSADTLTKYIARKNIYPLPIHYDTFQLTYLQSLEALLDTPSYYSSHLGNGEDTIIANTALFWGRQANTLSYTGLPPSRTGESYLFAKGLGRVIYQNWGQDQCCQFSHYVAELRYYSGSSGTFGTPYTSFTTSITEIKPNNTIRLSPIPSNGKITIEVTDENSLPLNFSIYNLAGQKVKQVLINNRTTNIILDEMSNGIYIWKALDNTNNIQAGKMVISQ